MHDSCNVVFAVKLDFSYAACTSTPLLLPVFGPYVSQVCTADTYMYSDRLANVWDISDDKSIDGE